MSRVYWRGFTPQDLGEFLDLSATETRRESKKRLRLGAKEIMDASKQMAPVDHGNLEGAHRLETVRLNKDDMEVVVSVGGVVNGVDTDEYVMEQHERLEPAPGADMQLGLKSQQKDAVNPPNRQVGGKFLERAGDALEEQIISDVAATLIAFGG